MKNNKKLKKWQKALIAVGAVLAFLVLSFVVLTVVLAVKDSKRPTLQPEEITTSVYENIVGWDDGEDDFVEADFTPVPIGLSDKGLSDFEKYIAAYQVDFDYADAYRVDAALAYLENHQVHSGGHKHDVRTNGILDADSLYKLVRDNNKRFMNSDIPSANWYTEYSKPKLKQYCQLMADMLNAIHAAYPQTDMDELCCYLYDLKILDRTGALDFAAVELDKALLHINEDMVENWSDLKNNDRMAEEILHHEMMHLFQISCSCNQSEGELRIGVSHEYEALEINPLRWYWLAEASAEMNACAFLEMDYVTYQSKIGYAETLNYILNLGKAEQAAKIQELYFDRNADIYALFDVSSEAEKKEFINMMYSVEILQQDPKDFTDWYTKEYNVDMIADAQEKIKLHLCVKEDALLYFSKLFYRNLARSVNSGEATLQDIYYLMRIYECDLQNHLSNNEVSYMIYFKDFYPRYLELREAFFKAIGTENRISLEQLEDGFAKYSINVKSNGKTVSPNCTLDFLTAEQKADVNSYCKRIYKKGYPNMRNAYEICREWLPKAPYENVVFDD